MGGLVQGGGCPSQGDGWLSQGNVWLSTLSLVANSGRWVAKSAERLLASAALWIRIQTSVKNTKMGDISKGVANTL
jgi:hypothetical protein